MSAAGKPYVVMERWGNCRICGEHQDLRVGVCFPCSDFVAGKKVSAVTHKLWDSRNPENFWFYSEDEN